MSDESFSVLMIEDNEADARYIELLLLESLSTEFHLQLANSLEEAKAKLAENENSFHVILADLGLKESKGLDTLARVRKEAPDIPTIVLTGLGDEEAGIQAMRNGAQDYLVKGEVDANLLIKTIRFAYERHQAERKARETETRERILSEQVPAILWTTDAQLRFTSLRGRGLADLDLKPDLGVTLSDYFQTDDPEFPPLKLHARALAGEPASDMVKWHDRYYQMHVEPDRNEQAEVIGTIGIAVDVTQQHNLELSIEAAQRIQQHLLPSSAPTCAGFEIAGACFPAERCSGDYYDFMPMPDKQLAIVVADAAGHGFGPALLAATVRSYLRVAGMQGKDVHEMLAITNWLLTADSAPDQFVTLFCCLLDPRTQSFKFTSAGHQAYLIDAYGVVSTLDSPSLPIGIDQQEIFSSSPSIKLREGDVILICTDGIVEAESPEGEHYGLRRAIHRVRKYRGRPVQEIIDSLYRSIIKFSQPVPQKDDITAVIVKVLASPDADTGSAPDDHAKEGRPESAR